ncbi:MAG: M28 family peptidase [Acidobacteria bacterium]|nr:M28 family peptidase [Acidobacteriota bacterium]
MTVRRPRVLALVAALFLPLSQGVAQAPAGFARYVDRAQLMREVAALGNPGLEGRETGSPGAVRARAWIVERFREIGITPAGTGGYTQPFTVTAPELRHVLPGTRPFQTTIEAANVVGRIPGRDLGARVIAITAHYDHLGVDDDVVYPGADDNASGVAVLLAAARHFLRSRPQHTMVFAALDAEEVGLHGAKTLVASAALPRGRVALNVNLDMVSRSAAHEIYAAGTYHTPWLTAVLLEVQRRASVRIRFGHDRPPAGAGGLEDWTRSSDHGAFHAAGIPFIYFGVEDHPDYHKPTDTADRIDPRFFGDTADMIVEAIRTFDARLP